MRLLLLPALASVLTLAACGGGSEPVVKTQTVTSAAPSTQAVADTYDRQDYIKKADPVCEHHLARLAPLGDDLVALIERADAGAIPMERALRRYAEILHDIGIVFEDLAAELRLLRRPRGDGAVIGRFVRLLDQIPLQMDVTAAGVRSLEHPTIGQLLKAYRQLTTARRRLARSVNRAQGIADGYGFKVCGRKNPKQLDRGLREELTFT